MKLKWARTGMDGHYRASGRGGDYTLRWTPYGTRKTWDVWRDGKRVPLSFTGRLKDAMRHAQDIEDGKR